MKRKDSDKGFSLVELIIVIAIIALLIAVLVPVYINYLEYSRESMDIQSMDHARSVAEAQYSSQEYDEGVTYYYDGTDDLKTAKPTILLGKGRGSDRNTKYGKACCSSGDYQGNTDYTNKYLAITFPNKDEVNGIVHLHWVN